MAKEYYKFNKQRSINEIEETDYEIDRMVYDLYGQTENEIEVVEVNG
ncbi:MAG: hypothetical protein SVM80_04965 [Halobacteriota archaeon]|nr:hypothetical protein [Halobacteriota archaeon]